MKELVSKLGSYYYVARKYDVITHKDGSKGICTIPLVVGIFEDEFEPDGAVWFCWMQ